MWSSRIFNNLVLLFSTRDVLTSERYVGTIGTNVFYSLDFIITPLEGRTVAEVVSE